MRPSISPPFHFHQTETVKALGQQEGGKDENKNPKNRYIETIVRHSEVPRRSGQICQADVQSHVRSHVRDSVDSFRKLWRHHPAILPSTPSDGKSRFIPHGVPERHLDREEGPRARADTSQRGHIRAHTGIHADTRKNSTLGLKGTTAQCTLQRV